MKFLKSYFRVFVEMGGGGKKEKTKVLKDYSFKEIIRNSRKKHK